MSTFIEQELQFQEDPDAKPHFVRKTTCKSLFCSKLGKGLIVAFAAALVVPTLAYIFVIARNVPDDDDIEHYSCLIREEFRISCGTINVSQVECEKANCCFNSTTGQCHHFLPSKYYYQVKNDGTYLVSQTKSPVGSSTLQNIKLTVQNKTANKISLIIHDSSKTLETMSFNNTNYSIDQPTKKLILEVFDHDGDSIFSTAKGALVASEKYWEWSFQLSNEALFGLDRNLIQLNSNESLTKVIYNNLVDHSTLPAFWAYQNKKFHGAVVKHDGPLEIQVLASNMVILRSLLGEKIEIELSLGPTPSDLYKHQIEETVVPPLWFLGAHNCRKGNTTILSEILNIYLANNDSSFDTDCIHENLFISLQKPDKSEDDIALLKAYIEEAINSGQKFLLSLPPHILLNESNELYQKAMELDLLYKYRSGIVYNGTYLGATVVYPDFSSESIGEYIQTLINWTDTTLGTKYISGYVLNDNWPQDDRYDNVEKKKFPYYTDAIDINMQYTLPWTVQGPDKVLHLGKHNSYGQYQYSALHTYLNSLISDQYVIISSTKVYGNIEPTILDNFKTTWDNFRVYLNKILFNSITGNQMIGIPVCGDTDSFNKSLHETLCIRWYIAAATMPYFRVSSGNVFRGPANLNSKYATKAAEMAMNRRALLQDYLYTILKKKEPVVRPMYYDYYHNIETFSMERQHTIGKDIIVAHPFSNGRLKLQVYLPPDKVVWYEFWGGTMFTPQKDNGYYVDIDVLETDWTMLVAQGSIIALTESTKIHFYIAMDCSSKDRECQATGELLKDNTLLSFSATNTYIKINGLSTGCNYLLGNLKLYNYNGSFEYTKNIHLCNGETKNVTIYYNNEV